MKKYILLFGLLLTVTNIFGQSAPPEYYTFIHQADSFYKVGDYLNSGLKYTVAFQSFGGLGYASNRYDAACSWAMAGYADSAFYNLQRIVEKAKFSDYKRIIADSALTGLYNDIRWTTLLLQIKENKDNKDKSDENYNKPLLYLLDSMATEDQKWRKYKTKHSNGELHDDTISIQTIYRNWIMTDSLNYFLLKEIFAEYGFPNEDLVGTEGSGNFWLLVQHQDAHPDFQDSVLTQMKIEVDANKASGSNYAYLVDRVKVNTGQLQVYGTQMELNEEETSYIPKKVIDPDKLNERRLSIGLDSIESYIGYMNQVYSGTLKKK